MYTQAITPNPNIPCQPGWCLQYVRQTYGLPARYYSATEAWEKSTTQHTDRDFPANLWVPVWYGIDTEPLGHVVLLAPDGSVYSTSDPGTTPHHHTDLTDLENYYAYYGLNLTYRGWTEDVAGYTVITKENELTAQYEKDTRGEWDKLRDFQKEMRVAAEDNRSFRIDVRNELAAHRAMLTADKGITEEQLLDTIEKAVIKVTVDVNT